MKSHLPSLRISCSFYLNIAFYNIFGKSHFFSFHTCGSNLGCSSSYSFLALNIWFMNWSLNYISFNLGTWVLSPGSSIRSTWSWITNHGSWVPVYGAGPCSWVLVNEYPQCRPTSISLIKQIKHEFIESDLLIKKGIDILKDYY